MRMPTLPSSAKHFVARFRAWMYDSQRYRQHRQIPRNFGYFPYIKFDFYPACRPRRSKPCYRYVFLFRRHVLPHLHLLHRTRCPKWISVGYKIIPPFSIISQAFFISSSIFCCFFRENKGRKIVCHTQNILSILRRKNKY